MWVWGDQVDYELADILRPLRTTLQRDSLFLPQQNLLRVSHLAHKWTREALSADLAKAGEIYLLTNTI